MSSLIERIRQARQTRVTVGGKVFVIRRPTDWEVRMMVGVSVFQMDVIEKFVEGWENFTELDLVPGGGSTPVPFNRELFLEWIADREDFWEPINAAVTAEYKAHRERLKEAEKK